MIRSEQMRDRPISSELHDKVASWRHHLHAHPELGFEEYATSDFIAARLSEMGIPFERGLAKTGIVARISGQPGTRAIGLRTEMDALPITESTGLPYASKTPGIMHACGHDGHIATLLGAAAVLSEKRDFFGTIFLIFQPAEETGGGGRVMIEEGLLDRYPLDEVYSLHNWPGLEVGQFSIRSGAVMAASDSFDITLHGTGCHAAMPNQGRDPIVAGAQIIAGLQSAISRRTSPTDAAVVSITQFHAGDTYNVVPGTAHLAGTLRSLNEGKRQELRADLDIIVHNIAKASDITAEIALHEGYPVACNTVNQADFAAQAAQAVSALPVLRDLPPSMGCEDFSYLLNKVPGCYVWLGSGSSGANHRLHNTGFDFNDALIPVGIRFWTELVAQRLQVRTL